MLPEYLHLRQVQLKGPIWARFYSCFVKINITNGLNCKHLLSTDEMFHKIDTTTDYLKFYDLDHISVWCQTNRLNTNLNRCKIVNYTREYITVQFDYMLQNKNLDRCSAINDLGIYFDSKLSFVDHIGMVVSDCLMHGFIHRICREITNANCLIT